MKKLPGIGLRIIKSAIAILLCFAVDYLRNGAGIVFYSQLSALWCMQAYRNNTRKNAIQRTLGTAIGAIYGLIYLLLIRNVLEIFTTYWFYKTYSYFTGCNSCYIYDSAHKG